MQFVYRLAAAVVSIAAVSCSHVGPGLVELEPLRISQLTDEGDAARKASMRLVIEGLDADSAGDGSRAQARYQRALSVDVANPYAYLAIARHHVEAGEPDRALQFLDRAESLLRMQGELEDEVAVHLDGLRGAALYDAADLEAATPLLDRARENAPRIWGDGALQADELR